MNPDEIIAVINQLSPSAREELTHKVRTSSEGIAAFQAFNYGVGEPSEAVNRTATTN